MKKHTLGKAARVPMQLCLRCGELVSAASVLVEQGKSEKARTPSPGDVTVCICCAHVMAFTDTLTMRELTADEKLEVADDDRIKQAVAAVHRRAVIEKLARMMTKGTS